MARGTIINSANGSVGDIRSSMLDLAQFQAENGTDWVLADGASAAGTKYNTVTAEANLPDLRGQFLRGKNNGRVDGNENPDGDSALGAFQDHASESHAHTTIVGINGTVPAYSGKAAGALSNGGLGNAGGISHPGVAVSAWDPNPFSGQQDLGITPTGGNETRAKNITVNYFIKVN